MFPILNYLFQIVWAEEWKLYLPENKIMTFKLYLENDNVSVSKYFLKLIITNMAL